MEQCWACPSLTWKVMGLQKGKLPGRITEGQRRFRLSIPFHSLMPALVVGENTGAKFRTHLFKDMIDDILK